MQDPSHSQPLPASITERAARKKMVTGLLFAATGAIAFSGKAIIVKLAYRYDVDPVTLIMLRMLFALPIFVVMAWWTSRGKPPLSGRDWMGVVGLGVTGYYLSSFFDFLGLQYVSASLERLMLYLNPTLVLLLGWLLYRKRASPAQMAGMAISYSGVVLVFAQELELGGERVVLGAVLVFMSALSYALYFVYSGELVKRLGSLRLAGLATTVACVCCVAQYVVMRPIGTALEVAPEVVWLSVLNATLCTAVPVVLVMMGIERIGPALSAQSGMIGPLSTIAMGVVILGEPFTPWLAVGAVLVIAGVFVVSRGASAPSKG